MKKYLMFVLILVLVVSVVACGNGSAQAPTGSAEKEVVTDTAEPTESKEIVVLDNNDVTFMVIGVNYSSLGCEINCFMENKTDKDVLFTWQDVSVDSYMIDPFFGQSVQAGKKANSVVVFTQDTLDSNGISKPSEIDFNLLVMPKTGDNEYDINSAYVNETFTVNLGDLN